MPIAFRLLRNTYQAEARAEVAKHAGDAKALLTPQELEHLPAPVHKYITYCGFVGREKIINARITWKDVLFRNEPGTPWMHIDYDQFNSVPEPVRLAYIHSSMMGLLPFEGYDKYKDGHGSMQVRLLKLLQVGEYKGPEMDASALVTILSESILLPGYTLQEYVVWEHVSDQAARARLTYNNTTVTGIFNFSQQGTFERFDTQDRYLALEGTALKRTPWSIIVDCYQEVDGLKFPQGATATWHLPDGDYDYFKGTIEEIHFNVLK